MASKYLIPSIFSVIALCITSCGVKGLPGDKLITSKKQCPTVELSSEELETLTQKGLQTNEENKMGEYYFTESLDKGMPMLRTAALQGSLLAQKEYSSMLIYLALVEMVKGPMGMSRRQAAEEGMMFHILTVHRGEPVEDHDKETYRILLDPSASFPKGFFSQDSGMGWVLQSIDPLALNRARKQAFLWKDCWE